jgi:hypothetical protein
MSGQGPLFFCDYFFGEKRRKGISGMFWALGKDHPCRWWNFRKREFFRIRVRRAPFPIIFSIFTREEKSSLFAVCYNNIIRGRF